MRVTTADFIKHYGILADRALSEPVTIKLVNSSVMTPDVTPAMTARLVLFCILSA